MRVVVALGGNALLRRGEPMTSRNQWRNIRTACTHLAPLSGLHQLVISHGNGPQVGLLAVQAAAADRDDPATTIILDASGIRFGSSS